MKPVYRMMAVWIVAVVAAVSVYGQDVPKDDSKKQTDQPVVVNQQTTTTKPDYVFPTHKERFNRYVKSTVGPFRLAWSAGAAGLDQWRDHPEEWGQGMKGFGRRYASNLGQNAIQQTVIYGLDEGFGLDTGFRKSTREGFGARLKDALLQNVTARTKSGKRVVGVPRFVGAYSAAVIARETWYPNRYTYKDGLRAGTGNLLTGFGINLIREFVFNF